MKDYVPGLLICDCSKAMRRGKPVKVYHPHWVKDRKCPNCRKVIHNLPLRDY